MSNRCKTLLRDHGVPEVTLRLAQGTNESQSYLRPLPFEDLKYLPKVNLVFLTTSLGFMEKNMLATL